MKRWALSLFVLPLAMGVTRAQMQTIPMPNPGMSNPTQWYINNQMYSMRVFNSALANSMLLKRGAKAPVKKAPAALRASQFAFTASILPKMLAAKAEPGKRAGMERFFESHLDLYRQTARKDGFPSNDLAYALEYFVVNNYHLYLGLIGSSNGISMPQERAIYLQFQQVLASNPGIKQMTGRQKQEVTESLAIMFGLAYQAQQSGNAEWAAQSRQVAKAGLEKLLGVSMEKIRVTDRGIEI